MLLRPQEHHHSSHKGFEHPFPPALHLPCRGDGNAGCTCCLLVWKMELFTSGNPPQISQQGAAGGFCTDSSFKSIQHHKCAAELQQHPKLVGRSTGEVWLCLSGALGWLCCRDSFFRMCQCQPALLFAGREGLFSSLLWGFTCEGFVGPPGMFFDQ